MQIYVSASICAFPSTFFFCFSCHILICFVLSYFVIIPYIPFCLLMRGIDSVNLDGKGEYGVDKP